MELYDLNLESEPYRVGIHTLPEVAPLAGDPAAMIDRIEALVGELLDAGKFVVTLEASTRWPWGRRGLSPPLPNLSVLALDAHADLRPEYLGTRYNHACTLRRIVELCPVVQVGLRSAEREEHEFIRQQELPFFTVGAYRR